MRITTHLAFDGQCREAFERYRDIFGGEIRTMLSYGESPMAAEVDPRFRDRIVHATLHWADGELAGSDVQPSDFEQPRGFFVLVTFDETSKAERAFSMLAVGGEVRLEFQSTFWSSGFGVVVDRFGVPWEITSAEPAAGT